MLFCCNLMYLILATYHVYAQENTTRAYISFGHYDRKKEPSSLLCYEPRNLHLRSCTPMIYPASLTTCKCSINNERTVNLKCNKDHIGNIEWLRATEEFPCTGNLDGDKVTLYQYWLKTDEKDKKAQCQKPIEFINYFHSCEEKDYPSNSTTCTCTYNSDTRIHFACIKGNEWLIYGPEHPCKYNFMPHLVSCYIADNVLICNCRSNCFTLDIKTKPSYDEIYRICDENNTKHHIKEKHLKLNFNGSNNKIMYTCEAEYTLVGSSELKCQQGILLGDLPYCSPGKGGETPYSLYKILTFILTSILLLVLMLLLLAVYIFWKKYKYFKSNTHIIEKIDNTPEPKNEHAYENIFTTGAGNIQRPVSEHVYDYIELPVRK